MKIISVLPVNILKLLKLRNVNEFVAVERDRSNQYSGHVSSANARKGISLCDIFNKGFVDESFICWLVISG